MIASGLMAGGALGGVFGAALRLLPGYTEDWLRRPFYDNEAVSQTVSAVLFVGLCVYVWKAAHGGERRKDPRTEGGRSRGAAPNRAYGTLPGSLCSGGCEHPPDPP